MQEAFGVLLFPPLQDLHIGLLTSKSLKLFPWQSKALPIRSTYFSCSILTDSSVTYGKSTTDTSLSTVISLNMKFLTPLLILSSVFTTLATPFTSPQLTTNPYLLSRSLTRRDTRSIISVSFNGNGCPVGSTIWGI